MSGWRARRAVCSQHCRSAIWRRSFVSSRRWARCGPAGRSLESAEGGLAMIDGERAEADPGRRAFLAASGALIVTLSAPAAWPAFADETPPPLAPDQLDSWIAIDLNGNVSAFVGKVDGGQGLDVAIAQIVAEELDVLDDAVTVVMGETARTINQ